MIGNFLLCVLWLSSFQGHAVTFEGLWDTGCVPDAGSFRYKLRFEENVFKEELWSYPLSALKCSIPPFAKEETEGTFEILEGDDTGIVSVNYHNKKKLVTPLDIAYAKHLNEMELCGFDDWKALIPKSVPLDCHGSPDVYSIARIESKSSGKKSLFRGQISVARDGSSSEMRFNTFENFPFYFMSSRTRRD